MLFLNFFIFLINVTMNQLLLFTGRKNYFMLCHYFKNQDSDNPIFVLL